MGSVQSLKSPGGLHSIGKADVQALVEKTTKQDKTNDNKTRQNLSYQGWTRKPNMRKSVLRAGKRVRDPTTPTVRRPKRISS